MAKNNFLVEVTFKIRKLGNDGKISKLGGGRLVSSVLFRKSNFVSDSQNFGKKKE